MRCVLDGETELFTGFFGSRYGSSTRDVCAALEILAILRGDLSNERPHVRNKQHMMQPESRLCQQERVLTQEAADTMILLSLDNGQYYELNDVGRSVWELCDGTNSIDEMITMVCDMYEAPAEAIRADVMDLLQELIEEKLLAVAS